jgi:hypothetical protein
MASSINVKGKETGVQGVRPFVAENGREKDEFGSLSPLDLRNGLREGNTGAWMVFRVVANRSNIYDDAKIRGDSRISFTFNWLDGNC